MDDKIFTPKQLAKYLETSVSALSQYRALGIGPVYLKIGRMGRYRMSDVDEWLHQKASRKN